MHDVKGKSTFYASVAASQAAHWQVNPGVTFVSRCEYRTWGIALQIDRRALRPGQLDKSLVRRFERPHDFDEYYLFLDPSRDFVVWHAVPPSLASDGRTLDVIRQQQLALVGLEHLTDLA